MARATAIQQQCYYFDVNAGGEQGCGQSIVIGPEGEVLTELSSNEEIALLEVDLDSVNRIRQRGIKGLGQPLKSFRDNPKYFESTLNKQYLELWVNYKYPKNIIDEYKKTPVTIQDVANKAKVSIKTVSRVINSEPNVAEKTIKKEKAIDFLDYQPNAFCPVLWLVLSPNYCSNL